MWIVDDALPQVTPTRGCTWQIIPNCDTTLNIDDDILDAIKQAAIEFLWGVTGRRYGTCERTIRPCLPGCDPGWQNTAWAKLGHDSLYGIPALTLVRCGRCDGACNCTTVHEFELPHRNIRRVAEIVVDGVTLGRSLYRRSGRFLYRLDGDTVTADLTTADQDGPDVTVGDLTISTAAVAGGLVDVDTGTTFGLEVPAGLADLTVTLLSVPGLAFIPSGTVHVDGATWSEADDWYLVDGDDDVVREVTITWNGPTAAQTVELPAVAPATTMSISAVHWSDLTLPNPGWPKCQDRNVDAGEPGSWTVRYIWGVPVPMAGRLASGMLICEMGKAYLHDDSCQLPKRIQTRVVDGETIGFLDPMTALKEGLTGLDLVDRWIISRNPNRLEREARAYRADDPRRHRRRR